MKIDSGVGEDLSVAAEASARIEREGYDGLWVGEAAHDPFLLSLQAATATKRITVGTSVAIAFARTPMTTAVTAFDLAKAAEGRFVLGLGSQIKAHIERRFSMPWSHPAARMREYVAALRAIWDSWQNGGRLSFEGDFYTHTLMTPFFAPPAHAYGPPPVYLAGVGRLMTEVAGEVCDGFFVHPFTTVKYLQEVTIPALLRGRAAAGHDDLAGFTVCGPSLVAIGRTEEELAKAVHGVKRQIAFYASTPAYRAVLDVHGFGDVQPKLTALSKQGQWREMADLITDEMLAEFAVVGSPEQVAAGLEAKIGEIYDRASLYVPYSVDPAALMAVLSNR